MTLQLRGLKYEMDYNVEDKTKDSINAHLKTCEQNKPEDNKGISFKKK